MLTTLCICTGAVVAEAEVGEAEVACCFDAFRSALMKVALLVTARWEERREAFGSASELRGEQQRLLPRSPEVVTGLCANTGEYVGGRGGASQSSRWQIHP